MFEKVTSTGLDLYQPFPELNQWVVDFKNGIRYHGTFQEVVSYLVFKQGFNTHEVDDAVFIMLEKDHNAIHFGMYKTFIFSFDKEINCEKAS